MIRTNKSVGILSDDAVVVIEMGAGAYFLLVAFLLILQYVICFGVHSSKFKSKALIEAF